MMRLTKIALPMSAAFVVADVADVVPERAARPVSLAPIPIVNLPTKLKLKQKLKQTIWRRLQANRIMW